MKRFSKYHQAAPPHPFARAQSNSSCNLLQKFQKVQLCNACISKQHFIQFHSLVELQCDIPKYIPYLRRGIFKNLRQDVANQPIEPLAMAAIYDCRCHSS